MPGPARAHLAPSLSLFDLHRNVNTLMVVLLVGVGVMWVFDGPDATTIDMGSYAAEGFAAEAPAPAVDFSEALSEDSSYRSPREMVRSLAPEELLESMKESMEIGMKFSRDGSITPADIERLREAYSDFSPNGP